MKTQNELNELKKEVEALNKKLAELTGDELMQVTGGADQIVVPSVDPRPIDPALPVVGR